ncbi:hypothetical protein TNCT_34441 [Trichonephila clavata]|uniref:Uncharacterized protein n=1 Tax=Trichonephila clavata TaxID=2740835 RepID=A0A8X6FUB5_TRICU|nr:hypothetical protein TNCT_34441 [Trichonephila clavata]
MTSKFEKTEVKRSVLRTAITKLTVKISNYLENDEIECEWLKVFKNHLIDQERQYNDLNNPVCDLISYLDDLANDIEESQIYSEQLIRFKAKVESKLSTTGVNTSYRKTGRITRTYTLKL